jgi:hypothetical protein
VRIVVCARQFDCVQTFAECNVDEIDCFAAKCNSFDEIEIREIFPPIQHVGVSTRAEVW